MNLAKFKQTMLHERFFACEIIIKKAYNAEIGDSYVAKIVGETISQLSMQKNMIMRGAAEIIAPIAPLAQPILAATKTNLPQIATLGAASAAGAVGATGAVAGAVPTALVFIPFKGAA